MTLLAAFDVEGTPVPQGSMKHVGNGRIVPSNALALKRWRRAVAAAAAEDYTDEPYDGPVVLDCVFRLERPRSRRKAGPLVSVTPDCDKLVRAIGDAITGVIITNDSRIVQQRGTKVYADAYIPTGQPGAYVIVRALDDRSTGELVDQLPHLRAA